MNAPLTLPKKSLHKALRETADRLDGGAKYQWTHQGSCNCGHLAQTICDRSPAEIHAAALERQGDWAEHAREYCPTSGYLIDHIVESLLAMGLTQRDLEHLERLSDSAVLLRLPLGERNLDHRNRDDTVRYLRTWAELVEERDTDS